MAIVLVDREDRKPETFGKLEAFWLSVRLKKAVRFVSFHGLAGEDDDVAF